MHRSILAAVPIAALLAGCQTARTESAAAWPSTGSLGSFNNAAVEADLDSDAIRLAQVAFGRPGEIQLGAGDTLGRMIYLNDIVLARRNGVDHPGLWVASVPE